MGHSQADKSRSRERILAATAQQMRERGIGDISIAGLMEAADLTHGAFYAHFPSRDALMVAALDRALENGAQALQATEGGRSGASVRSIVNSYLSRPHRDNPGEGCAVATLASEVGRSKDDQLHDLMTRRLETNFRTLAKAMGDGPAAEGAAVAAWCAMVGALTLSRVFPDDRRADEILRFARRSILELEKHVRAQDAQATRS